MFGPRWSRRNRWALLGLPLALIAAVGASSDRVDVLYRQEGLHTATSGLAGRSVTYTDTYSDSAGEHARQVQVRLDSVRAAGGLDVPPGSRALVVSLTLRADPRTPLSVCRLALRDADGTRYDYLPKLAGLDQAESPCVPSDTPGPFPALGELDAEPGTGSPEPARPATWTVRPVVVLPADAGVSEVVLWWQLPRYVALRL